MTESAEEQLRKLFEGSPAPTESARTLIEQRLRVLRGRERGRLTPSVRAWPRPRLLLVVAGVAAAMMGGFIGPSLVGSTDFFASADGKRTVPSGVDKLVAEDTASEVVTWADQVVVATPVAESKVWGETELTEDGSGDGLVMRRLTIKIDETLWSRRGSETPSDPFSSLEWGWVVKEQEISVIGAEGTPRYELGRTYMMSIVYDRGTWSTLGEASFPLDQGVVAPEITQTTPFARQSAGMSPSQLATVLEQTPPLTGAEPFLSLPFQDRVEAFYASPGGSRS